MAREDDAHLNRFDRADLRRHSSREAVLALALTTLLLILFAGDAVGGSAETLSPGIGRDTIEAVGEPTGWVADNLPLADVQREITAGLSPDTELIGEGFDEVAAVGSTGPPAVTPDFFDPVELGEEGPPAPELRKLLITGDSMSMPLDAELARRLSPDGVETIREPRLGSGLSRPELVDWAQLSTTLMEQEEPDAVVMFIGAGDGYPLPGPDGEELTCCGPDWAAAYANRARRVMDTFSGDGRTRVYWLTVPTPRDDQRARNTSTVNAAVEVAAQAFVPSVRLIDLIPVFTPDEEYVSSLVIDGEEEIVRDSDGLHLNQAGAEVAADAVLEQLEADFSLP